MRGPRPRARIGRGLPSLIQLGVFEAAARYGNFTRAAEELDITQGAVSRQIAQLEEFLGITLFERVRRRVIVTEAGKDYAAKISDVLKQAERATLELTSKDSGRVLTISSYAAFASAWLAGRLPSFVAQHPDIPFQLTALTHERRFAFAEKGVDVAIHYGEGSWPDALLDFLMHEEIIPVCSPAYARSISIATPADLHDAVLLHQIHRTDAWGDLLAKLNMSRIPALQGPRFDQYAMIIEAAEHGLGVAAIPRYLIERQLQTGRLVHLFGATSRSRFAYYLAFPETKRHLREVQAFRRWITAEARSFKAGRPL